MECAAFLGPAFLICAALAGIHCCLGLHVLARKIVFADLALAQAGAFGMAMAMLWGHEPGSLPSYWMTLSGALAAALFFAFLDSFKKYFPKKALVQEAFIGLVYALFSVLALLLFDRAGHGAEWMKQALTGRLIWASKAEALKILLICGAAALIGTAFHKPLWRASNKGAGAKWNLLFYGLFSAVIASSVSLAGILLVFSFLISPALVSGFLFRGFRQRLFFGWAAGAALTAAGLGGSCAFNLPAGPFVAFLFALFPILFVLSAGFGRFILRRRQRRRGASF